MTVSKSLVAALMLAGSLAVAAPPARADASGADLVTALKSGGYVIYFRHSISDLTQNDADPIKVDDCSTQRGLADAGRAQAKKIGAEFDAMGIAVEKAYSSAYCRAKETAALAFPKASPQASPALFYSLALPKDEAAKAVADLKKILATAPAAGKNVVLIGHTSNLKEAAGVWPKVEGGAFVFKPDGNGGFTVAGSFDPADIDKAAAH